jgi:RNA polymerase sigma factor (sigma-70 family)
LGKEEAELIARCRKGDIQSYALLYNRYSQSMYHTCLRVVLHAADAEDILQDAFMEAFMNLGKLKNTEAFGGWLKRIVLNKSINHVKRNRQSWLEMEEADLADIPGEQSTSELEFAEKLEAVMEALNGLPEKYRIVINLYVFEQMNFEKIATLMELTSSTVRVQYMRGRQKILNRVRNK